MIEGERERENESDLKLLQNAKWNKTFNMLKK